MSRRQLLQIAAAQALLYAVVTVNFRMVAQGNLPVALLTDFAVATLNFFVIRRIVAAEESVLAWAAYTAGGLVGTTLGMLVSR